MGTEKRARQKANRQQRLIEEAKLERTSAIKRNFLRWTLVGVLAVGAVVFIAWIGGAFSGDDEEDASSLFDSDSTTPATLPLDTTPDDTTPVETTPPGGTTAADDATGKPSVQVPEELPTALVVTTIEAGTGPEAQVGDTIEVNYVGVRSADGVEFDNSFDRGTTFPFTLGQGAVIQGWDEGLVGAQAGEVLQLDIPADLAYGDADRGVIRPGDALSFVVEVVSITPAAAE